MSSSSSRPMSRSSFTSTHSAHSTTSPPRLSIDKRHAPDRRLSTDSTIRTTLPSFPGIASLPGISHTSPLAAAGPRGMPPPTPPKDRLPPPQTPTRKPVQRQKSPLSTETFSSASPVPSMPGAFPTTPSPGPAVGLPQQSQFNTTAYASAVNDSPPAAASANSKNPGKRTSSLRGFLPFKALRRSYDNNSSENSPRNGADRPASAFGMRPTTPSGESVLSGSTNPSLRKKMSGSFWKRKSSLGFLGGEKTGERASVDTSNRDGSPANGINGNGALPEEEPNSRSATPVPGDQILGLKKRKSGTFWRRKSSLNLLRDSEAGAPGTNGSGIAHQDGVQYSNGKENGNKDVVIGRTDDRHTGYGDDWKHGVNDGALAPARSTSPPPQIPAFVGGGGGLGLEAEDMFRDIQ